MKNISIKSYLSGTLRRVLRPLVRIAMRGELTCKEFSELLKLAYFDVARDDYGINGRKTNIARVAILTGLSRKECSRLKALESEDAVETGPMSPSAKVITAWHEEPDYQSPEGGPRDLPASGEAPSLSALLRDHAGDIPPGALLVELQRIGAIESVGGDVWRLVKRSFIAEGFSQENVRILGNQLSDLGSTVVHNIESASAEAKRLQRYVVSDNVSEADAEHFKLLAAEKGQELLEEFDAWLATRPPHASTTRHPAQRVGVGIYYFQNSPVSGEQ